MVNVHLRLLLLLLWWLLLLPLLLGLGFIVVVEGAVKTGGG